MKKLLIVSILAISFSAQAQFAWYSCETTTGYVELWDDGGTLPLSNPNVISCGLSPNQGGSSAFVGSVDQGQGYYVIKLSRYELGIFLQSNEASKLERRDTEVVEESNFLEK
jgi:hypothetical protein